MIKKMLGILICMLMIATVFPTVMSFPTEGLDQQQTEYYSDYQFYTPNWWGAQSFIPTYDILTRAELYMRRDSHLSGYGLVLSVRSSLTGADLVSVLNSDSLVSTSNGWVEFDFSNLTVTPGSTYYLVLRTPGWGTRFYWGYGLGTPYYDGFWLYSASGGYSWYMEFQRDFCFKTYGMYSALPAPDLSCNPSSYNFTSVVAGNTASTSFEIWNNGTGKLTYNVSESSSWVTVTPTHGVKRSWDPHDTITVSINTTGLSPGSYTCPINISSNGGNETFNVYVTVIAPNPVLAYNPTSYNFGDMLAGQINTTDFEIWNNGTGKLTYNVSESSSWVTVYAPINSSSNGEHVPIREYINTTGLSPGSYTCPINISSNGGNGTFTVYVTVIAPPTEALDQQQTQHNRPHLMRRSWFAQSFKPRCDILTRVELYIAKFGITRSDLVLSVRSSLTGADLVSTTRLVSEIKGGWVEFNFSDLAVTPGNTYYLVLRAPNSGLINYFVYYANGILYPNGAMWYHSIRMINWRETPGDLCFKTHGMQSDL